MFLLEALGNMCLFDRLYGHQHSRLLACHPTLKTHHPCFHPCFLASLDHFSLSFKDPSDCLDPPRQPRLLQIFIPTTVLCHGNGAYHRLLGGHGSVCCDVFSEVGIQSFRLQICSFLSEHPSLLTRTERNCCKYDTSWLF